MKQLCAIVCLCCAATFSFGAAYEPFSYPAGTDIYLQTNVDGFGWTAAGPAGSNVVVAPGSLTYAGLALSGGNSIQYGASNGPSARFNFLATNTSGTVFYSFLFKVNALGALGTSGGFFAGFNNSSGAQSTTPTVVGARTALRATGDGGFNVGLTKANANTFDTNRFAPGDAVFVVGSYTFNTGSTTDDSASLWINPGSTNFGSAIAPPANLTSTSGNDLAQIASFVFFRRGTASSTLEPPDMISDELRVGTTWADVTPAASMPALRITARPASVIVSWPTNDPRFALESTTTLMPSGTSWAPATGMRGVADGEFSVTNDTVAPAIFFRLRQ